MKSLQKSWIPFVALLLLGATATGNHDNLKGVPQIEMEGSHTFVIEWEVRNNSLISEYQLERKMSGNGSGFQSLNNSCQNVGNRYRCKDSDLYKGSTEQTAGTENVVYRLTVWHPDNSRHNYFEAEVQYTTNAVRRTWGSIKSMFQ